MKQSLFPRIFILYGSIMLFALIGMELLVTGVVRDNSIRSLRDSLATQTDLIAREIPFQSSASLDPLCRSFRETARARVTVISLNGKVLGDSDHESTTMDNHLDRIEIREADLSGTGMTIRHSDTIDEHFLYVARKVSLNGGTQGFVRLSVPLGEVESAVNRLRFRIVLSVASILLAAALFPIWQIERLRRFTLQIRNFASSAAKGDLSHRLFLGHAGEFDEIADSLSAMSLELKQSIAATEEERNRLSVILSSIPDALLISDAKGLIRLTSTASHSFFSGQRLLGKRFIEIVRDSQFLSVMKEVLQTRQSGTAEVRLDQHLEQHCIVHFSPLFYRENEFSGLVALFHDVTRLKKLEQMRTDFVANLSHEIRTPITAIQGFAETLLDGALNDEDNSRNFIETIRENSRRINNLVDDLMTISQIELGVITVERSDIDFGDVAVAVIAILGRKAASKGISLKMAVPPDFGTLCADRDRLVQILTNLVDNAIKFTEKGEVLFGIRDADLLGSGKTEIFVADTGIGIPDKHLPRLGERFYRVDGARSRTMGGTGLGLAIVKHLIRAHGWNMIIESTYGKGTTVRILIKGEQSDSYLPAM